MLCDRCNRNKATVHFTKIINGKKIEMHLCKECAREKSQISQEFSMENFLSDMFGGFYVKDAETDYKCPNCGMTYEQFKRFGKFGCSECVNTFKDKVEPLIQNIHGHKTHKGKHPKSKDIKESPKLKEIEDLRRELEEAVKTENYEFAAKLRDKIKNLEKLETKEG